MTILDIVIVIVFLISLLVGLMRGFVREVLSIVTWVVSIWLGLQFYSQAGEFFKNFLNNELFRNAAGFAVVFFGSLLMLSMVSYLINKIVTKTGIKGTDRVLGSVFGMGRAIFVVALLMLFGRSINMQETDFWKNSQLLGHFVPVADTLNTILPDGLRVDGTNSNTGLSAQGKDIANKTIEEFSKLQQDLQGKVDKEQPSTVVK
ncbi:MAG: CvpA family protein [Arenicella sp.]